MAQPKPPKRFSIPWFLYRVLLQALLLVGFIWVLFPSVWYRQLAAGPLAFGLVFVAVTVFNCFFEWTFHRYVLHLVPVKFLKHFTIQHRRHHELTEISVQTDANGAMYTVCEYPIDRPEKYEASAFPWYALLAFWAVFTPGYVVLQVLFPTAPILLGGYAAITVSYLLYEVVHQVDHFPYEWWEKAVNHPRFGRFWTTVYGFHHMHHANFSCNDNVVGFLGYPLADKVNNTLMIPGKLLLTGRRVTAKELRAPKTHGWVTRLDRWAIQRENRMFPKR
jgi:hemolysin III